MQSLGVLISWASTRCPFAYGEDLFQVYRVLALIFPGFDKTLDECFGVGCDIESSTLRARPRLSRPRLEKVNRYHLVSDLKPRNPHKNLDRSSWLLVGFPSQV